MDINRGLIAAVIAFGLEKFYVGEPDSMKCATFGALTGTGIVATDMVLKPIIQGHLSGMLPGGLFQERDLVLKPIEIGADALLVYYAAKYLQAVDLNYINREWLKHMLVIVAADLGSSSYQSWMNSV